MRSTDELQSRDRTGRVSDYLLITQVFPPAIGGSGVLLQNVYSRVGGNVVALIDRSTCGDVPSSDSIRVIPLQIPAHSWGLFDARRWPNQLHLARKIYRMAASNDAIVHCGRAQPEAVPALLASAFPGGPRYLFWAHGEDITAAMSSRHFAATMRLVHRGASAAIANSQNTARMVSSLGWHRGAVHVVYPGVDAIRFNPGADDGSLRRRLSPDGELVLLSVSRLQRRKGHELVLRALPGLLAHVPRIRYVIVGDGDERTALEELVRRSQLEHIVQFEGEVSSDALPGYFAACDVFVLPTRVERHDFEGFGIVYLEAAAAGKPTIGGRNGGVPEAVVDAQTGLLVSGDSVEELGRVLRTLCESDELRQRMGQAGRERAVREFTWERAAEQVARIHVRLSGDRSAASV